MHMGNLLVKAIELPTRLARRLLDGSILCTMATVILLCIIYIIWCHISNLT